MQRVSARFALAALLVALAAHPVRAQAALDWARQLYNLGRYDQAIEAATRLRVAPTADAASLLVGRSYLERFRQTRDQTDLSAAREALRAVRPAGLGSTDRTDYILGLGELLYLEESFGPAVELFRIALDRGAELGPRALERVFDWWATALDRQVQAGVAEDREAVYTSIRDRARSELGRMPGSSAASYWLVASHRYLGNLTEAWDAAVAGWIRAPLGEHQGLTLRADLDQLVIQAIIPERARLMSSTEAERDQVAAALRAGWEGVKKDWPSRK